MFNILTYLAFILTYIVCSPFQSKLNTTGVQNSVNNALTQLNDYSAENSPLTTSKAIVGGLAIVAGIFLVTAGYRIFKAAMYIAGFIFFSNLTFLILTRLEPDGGYSNRDAVMFLVPLAGGILGGFLTLKFYRVGLSLLGFLAGFSFGLLLLSLKTDGLVQSGAGRIAIVLILGIVGAVMIHWFEKPAVMLSTSLLGAYAFMFGVDVFVRKGFSNAVQKFFFGDNRFAYTNFEANTSVIVMVIATVIIAGLGTVHQYKAFSDHKHR